ncbi:hypothetical protein KBF38_22770 [bacterium]|nr:hypothetical protein [bacterium]
MSNKALLIAAVCIGTQLVAPSVVLADSVKSKFAFSDEYLQRLQREDYRAAEVLKTAKHFAKEEKYDEADKAFKQAEELMLGYKGDQFFLKIVYEAQIYFLNKHNRAAESEAVGAKLKAAALRIPRSPIYESNAVGPAFLPRPTGKVAPTLPDGPPIPDDQ